jgi:hypothetical protein
MPLKQNIAQSALVAAALAFKPFQHVGIYPHGQLLFNGPVKLAALCALLTFALYGRQVREVNLAFRLGGLLQSLPKESGQPSEEIVRLQYPPLTAVCGTLTR